MCALAPGAPLLEHPDTCLPDRSCGRELKVETSIVQIAHPDLRRPIFDGPEAHDDRSHARYLKRASQAKHAFTSFDLPGAGVARRQYHPLGALKVQSSHFFRRQDSVVAAIRPSEAVYLRLDTQVLQAEPRVEVS